MQKALERQVKQPSLRQFPAINRGELETLQVNLGYRCNQACSHCHVDAGPNRVEEMSRETIEQVLRFACARAVKTLDLTGGAPELNPHFRYLVSSAREAGIAVIDRCNLTILEEDGQHDLANFLGEHKVCVVASLPCYTADNVDLQRGKNVFEKSIRGLKKLNALGYAEKDSGLELYLVYNPVGAVLAPPQAALEATYRDILARDFGVTFSGLLTLSNMPIARFRHALERDNELESYLQLLVNAHSASNLEQVMCRSLISVDWRGYVYDCDFNQMLKLPLAGESLVHITELTDRSTAGMPIAVADHCYGCTAGQGSSCSGALTD